MLYLKGKNILVTGGANGIGRVLVNNLVKEGSNVGVIDLDEKGLNDLKKNYKNITTFCCDITDEESVRKVIENFHSNSNTIDVLVNNAGVLYSAPLVNFHSNGIQMHDFNDWRKIIEVNLNSVFYVSCNVISKMIGDRTKGVIVNISSISAAGNSGQSAYSAAKAGVNSLTATWAKELSPLGIRVVGVSPGFSDTNSTKTALNETIIKKIKKEIPLKRLADPQEIVEAILFGIKNDYMNGKVIEIDGGLIVS